MGVISRLNKVSQNSKFFRSDPADDAGRMAEYIVKQELSKKIKGTSWEVDSSLRVPDWQTSSRREFDFIITSPDFAVAVELKNWSGEIYFEGNDLIQERRFDNGILNHGPIFLDLENKVKILKAYSSARCRENPPLHKIVVFYNSNINIEDEIEGRDDVMLYNDLLEIMPEMNLRDKQNNSHLTSFLEAIMRYFGYDSVETKKTKEKTSYPTIAVKDLRKTLAELGTWDVIDLHGSQVIFGDLLDREKSLMVSGINLSDRSKIKSIDIDVDRSYINALFREPEIFCNINFRNGKKIIKKIEENEQLHYQAAGASTFESISIRHVDRIEYGYTKRPKFHLDWELLKLGKVYTGIITGCTDFGLFVDIGAPKDGLVHISKLPKSIEITSYEKNDLIQVQLINIKKEKEKISLSLA